MFDGVFPLRFAFVFLPAHCMFPWIRSFLVLLNNQITTCSRWNASKKDNESMSQEWSHRVFFWERERKVIDPCLGCNIMSLDNFRETMKCWDLHQQQNCSSVSFFFMTPNESKEEMKADDAVRWSPSPVTPWLCTARRCISSRLSLWTASLDLTCYRPSGSD